MSTTFKFNCRDYQPAADLLVGKVILITGAGTGIGAAAAQYFAAYGATVILLGDKIDNLTAVYDKILAINAPKPAIYPFNLEGAKLPDYQELALTLANEFGRLDGILHNAALLGELTPLQQYPLALWQRVLQVNLTAPFLLTQACLELLGQTANSRIIFTLHPSSAAYWGAYGVAKAALASLMQICADELENQSILVYGINPVNIASPLQRRVYPASPPDEYRSIDSILPAYLYLMSDQSRELHGQIVQPV